MCSSDLIVFIGKTRIMDQLIFEEKRKECNISKIGYFSTVPGVKSFETCILANDSIEAFLSMWMLYTGRHYIVLFPN